MSFSPLTEQLIQALRTMPGVGYKSAQKMALYFLERDRGGARRLAQAIDKAMDGVGHCEDCRLLTESPKCHICSDATRVQETLCVVENPTDVSAIEASGGYEGLYFVLMGHLSPIDGIGPEDIGIDQLINRLKSGTIKELILATNPTVEGEATAHYISSCVKDIDGLTVSRIAHGVPVGSELEQVDAHTLNHAISSRKKLD